jgi:zinc protease
MKLLALSGAALCALAAPVVAQVPPAILAKSIDIPYQQFTLPNGLRVLVHTDRKAPIVAISVWYDVGSKHEPRGKTGFAHLFEHLMFNGSENAPGDFFVPLKEVGATGFNGTTWFDRTNYFETVPTAALERALFLESDRMGYLTGAITQAVLDEQRGVVQNEKRQGDNQPYGLNEYKQLAGLFPAGHPYSHSVIGSMADLDAASLDTVKEWFKDHYGPNNAVLVLAGDIDMATARHLVGKYFGAIPTGPKSVLPQVSIPTLAAPVSETNKDRVAAVRISRSWAVPGLNDPDAQAMDIAAGVLGGLSSSRLRTVLVRQEKLASSVTAENSSLAQIGIFEITVTVRPGVDPALAARRLDEVLASFLKSGPTKDEVERYVTRSLSARVAGLESVGGFRGKAVTLAEGALYSNDPEFYKQQMARLAAETPAQIRTIATKWLSRPAYTLTTVPGPRDAYIEAQAAQKVAVQTAPTPPAKGTRGTLPNTGRVPELSFPKVQRARLANGIEIVHAQVGAIPFTRAEISFDAGAAADVADKLGTQQLTLSMLSEGTTTRNSEQIAEASERLGTNLTTGSSLDRTYLEISGPSANLGPALDLLADVARNPAFAPAEVDRVRNLQLARIAQEATIPAMIGNRVLAKLLYGPGSPYAKSAGSGDPRAVATLTRDDLVAWQRAWLRPEKAKIFVVSDKPLAQIVAALDKSFGDWKGAGAPGTKPSTGAFMSSAPKIVLVDRPDSPQSAILGGLPTGLNGSDELLPHLAANDALGGGFLSRINMDLREEKHWAYGAAGSYQRSALAAPYVINAPVQADHTGDSIASLIRVVTGFVTAEPMTQVEFDRSITGSTRALPGMFETGGAILQAMEMNDIYRRPDDYYANITQKYQTLTLPQLRGVSRSVLDPSKIIWVVVGDAKIVRPQLDQIGLPVEVVPLAEALNGK